MNEQNLKPFKAGESRTVEAGQKGGVASGKARRERMKELVLAELNGEAQKYVAPRSDFSSLEGIFDKGHFEPAGYTRRAAVAKKLVTMAEHGDLKAIKLVFDLTEGGDDAEDNHG